MNYRIHITGKTKHDLNEAADYIEFPLLNRQDADDLLDKAKEELGSLPFMPEKYKASMILSLPLEVSGWKSSTITCPKKQVIKLT